MDIFSFLPISNTTNPSYKNETKNIYFHQTVDNIKLNSLVNPTAVRNTSGHKIVTARYFFGRSAARDPAFIDNYMK